MTVRIACALSTVSDSLEAALQAGREVAAALAGAPIDLAVVFACGSHLAAPEATLEGVHEALAPAAVIGCGAGGVVGAGKEIEEGTAVAVWAASFDGGSVTTFHTEVAEADGGVAIGGMPDLEGAAGAILLPDPYSFPTDGMLAELHRRAPGVPLLGGLASARTLDGESALFHGERVLGRGAVGVRFDGIDLLPCVSQGATPIGPELTITAGDAGVIHELGGEPALEALRAVVDELDEAQRRVLDQGLLIGIVVQDGRQGYGHGDFLVRGLLGGDPDTGSIAVGTPVYAGQVVRLHARDAVSADKDLREALRLRKQAFGGGTPAGALMFTCNGRGRGMFGVADHDALTLDVELGGVPAAGFFAGGEIGPVGGQSFLHGFTATVAVFAP